MRLPCRAFLTFGAGPTTPNDAAAQYALAKLLMKSSRPDMVKRVFALFKKLANQDYTRVQTEARYMLGVCYENGYGIQKS